MKHQSFHIGLDLLERRRLLAFDLLSDAAGLSAATSATVNGSTYFFADDGVHGRELWKTDGTASGTVLVKDLTPGADSSELSSIYALSNGKVVFLTVVHNKPSDRRDDDFTLWSTDGTAGGTVKLAQFDHSVRLLATQAADQVALVVNTPAEVDPQRSDAALYYTDGTATNTRLVMSYKLVSNDEDNPVTSWDAENLLAAGPSVVIGFSGALWASDGTGGRTFDLSEVQGGESALAYIAAIGDKVIIPSGDGENIAIIDGRVEVTYARGLSIQGDFADSGAHSIVAGNIYYFFTARILDDHQTLERTVYAFNPDTAEITLLQTSDDKSGDFFQPVAAVGSKLLFGYTDYSLDKTILMVSDGTAQGTVKLTEIPGQVAISDPIDIDGTTYFAVADGPHVDADPFETGVYGWVGAGAQSQVVNAPGDSTVELWRSDGTSAGTGPIRTIWKGDANGKDVHVDLSSASGNLVVRTTIKSGLDPQKDNQHQKLVTIFDSTDAYDPPELTSPRATATARLVNGVLHVNGTTGDDDVSVFRRASDPKQLVVEMDGHARAFSFSSIRRIVADLQDGNDRFEIIEGDGGAIRTRTSVMGGDGADTIITGTGRDAILGGNGADKIISRGNADTIVGGSGSDKINAGAGNDQIAGGTGTDRIIGGQGADVLFGQSAIEAAFGKDVDGENALSDVLLNG